MARNRHKNKKPASKRSSRIRIGSQVKVTFSPYDNIPNGTLAKVVDIHGPWHDQVYILNCKYTAFRRSEIQPA